MGRATQLFDTMKHATKLATLLLPGLALADLEAIKAQMSSMIKAQNASFTGEFGANLRAQINDNREFTSFVFTALQPLYDYGCWCHFGAEWPHAGGPVQDSVDSRCKVLINGYRCAKIDALARGEECDAGTIAYTPYNWLQGDPMVDDCTASNAGNQCAIDACMIEGSFSVNYLPEIVQGAAVVQTLLNPNLQAANGWDRDASCVTNPGSTTVRACCGAQPNRAPYSMAAHECCVDAVTAAESLAVVGNCP